MIAPEADAEQFAKDCNTMRMERISIEAACAHLPIVDPGSIAFAAHEPNAQDIDTDLLLQGFAKQLRGNGGAVLLKSPVQQITSRPGGWLVKTPQTDLSARHLVNAAGAWADEIAVLAGVAPIGLQPMRRSMARVPAPEGADVSGWPMVFGAGESWYSKPDAGALLISPADEDPCPAHDAWADDLTVAEGIARFESHMTHEVKRVITTWAGLRTFAPDRTLVVGPDPEVPHFIWCAGQGGYGVQSAPGASQLLADLVAGRPPQIEASAVEALDPKRFR